MKAAIVLGGGIPVALLVLVLMGNLSVDMAGGIVQAMLSLAPIPLIVGNNKHKTGQSKASMVTLGSGLLSLGLMFATIGLFLTGAAIAVSGALWSVVAVQAFIYAKPSNTPSA